MARGPSKYCNGHIDVFGRVPMSDPKSCWAWPGRCDDWGYGNVRCNRKLEKAHRMVFELFNGPIPEGMIVMHTCDNPPCCNPRHLRLGTHKQNSQDRERKGRRRILRGEDHARSKLTRKAVIDILESDKGSRELAKKYEVLHSHICDVRGGRVWRHVYDEVMNQ